MQLGLRAYLGVPEGIAVYLDNGAFYFGSQPGSAPLDEYEEFVEKAEPDWKPHRYAPERSRNRLVNALTRRDDGCPAASNTRPLASTFMAFSPPGELRPAGPPPAAA